MTLMVALFVVTSAHGTAAGCGGLYGNAVVCVREADVITQARAVEGMPSARALGVSTQVGFEIVETLKGGANLSLNRSPGANRIIEIRTHPPGGLDAVLERDCRGSARIDLCLRPGV
jgi:hypothetical protein